MNSQGDLIFYARVHLAFSEDRNQMLPSTPVRVWREDWPFDVFDIVPASEALSYASDRKIRYLYDDEESEDWDGFSYLEVI